MGAPVSDASNEETIPGARRQAAALLPTNQLLLQRAGATLDSLVHSEPGPTRLRLVENIVGILIAEPGTRPLGRLLVDLAPGQTYVLYCNFQDGLDKPRHMAIGMVASILVKSEP